jgi:class 3 adenylate cyclase
MDVLLSDEIERRRGGHQSGIETGVREKSADELIELTSPASGPRIVATRLTASALSTPAQPGELLVASVIARPRLSAERVLHAFAPSEHQPSVPRRHAIVKSKGTLDATVVAAETTHAAVLFADMRGYTALAEGLQPPRVLCLLDEFFTVLARVTVAFGGEVFHMAGDGMMAGFGVRDPKRSGARAALAAGHAMLESFAPVAARWRDEFAVVTGIGIGLHSGEVALGFLGPPGKQAITMIGDTANVAARLCSRARAGEVLFSCAVAAALGTDDHLRTGAKAFLQLPQFELRGRSGLLDIWCVPTPERITH